MTYQENCYLALCFDEDDEYDTYIEQLTERLTEDPGNVILLNNRGLAFLESGRYAEAEADFKRACALTTQENECTPFQNLAIALMALERLEDAIDEACKVVEANPNNASAYYTRHRVYKAAGRDQLAHNDLQTMERLIQTKSA